MSKTKRERNKDTANEFAKQKRRGNRGCSVGGDLVSINGELRRWRGFWWGAWELGGDAVYAGAAAMSGLGWRWERVFNGNSCWGVVYLVWVSLCWGFSACSAAGRVWRRKAAYIYTEPYG